MWRDSRPWRKAQRLAAASLCCALICFALCALVGTQALGAAHAKQQAATKQATAAKAAAIKVAAKNGLVAEKGQLRWYKKGVLQKNVKKKLEGATYYFDKKGNAVRGKAVKLGKAYWIFGNDGKLLTPAKAKYRRLAHGKYYVNADGHPAKTGWFTSKGRLRYIGPSGKVKESGTKQGIKFKSGGWAKVNRASRLKVEAMMILKRYTKTSWSRSKKLSECWYKWVIHHGAWNDASSLKDVENEAWVQREALRAFTVRKTDCYARACAIAMIAYELGFTPKVVIKKGRHAWVLVDGRCYDGGWPYARTARYYPGPLIRYKVVSYAATSPKGKSTTVKVAGVSVPKNKTGWVTSRGERYYVNKGKLKKSQWIRLGGKRYYLTKSGAAAVGSVKVKKSNDSMRKAYFVFGEDGALQTGTSTRVVTVNGEKYRVGENGRAASGWTSGKKAYYLKDGSRARGVRMVKGKLCSFGAKGAYSASKTKKLRKAAKAGVNAKALKKLLGKAESKRSEASCRPSFSSEDGVLAGEGTEYAYAYEHVKLYTYKAPGGKKQYVSLVEAA